MSKKIIGTLKLQVPAGLANPGPPVGPALASNGLNVSAFCKAFNEKTKQIPRGKLVNVVLTAYVDRSFTFDIDDPSIVKGHGWSFEQAWPSKVTGTNPFPIKWQGPGQKASDSFPVKWTGPGLKTSLEEDD